MLFRVLKSLVSILFLKLVLNLSATILYSKSFDIKYYLFHCTMLYFMCQYYFTTSKNITYQFWESLIIILEKILPKFAKHII